MVYKPDVMFLVKTNENNNVFKWNLLNYAGPKIWEDVTISMKDKSYNALKNCTAIL